MSTDTNNDTVKLYRESHNFVRSIIQEDTYPSYQPQQSQFNNTLVLEEADSGEKKSKKIGVLKKVANILATAAKNNAKAKLDKGSAKVKDTSSKVYEKTKEATKKNVGKIAMGAAAAGTVGLTAKALMDDEDDVSTTTEKINESEYTDKLYSTKSEPADPTKEDNNSGVNFVEKKDPSNPKDQVEYAHKTLPKEENLVGNPKSENAVEIETVEEAATACCESCKTGGACESLQESMGYQELQKPEKTSEVNLYSILSKII